MEIEFTRTSENRNSTVDTMKGILICMVVLGHTYNPFFTDFIYLFHVGVFFIISGYCFNQKYVNYFRGLMKLVRKRIKDLWIPYITYNFIFLLLQNFFIKIGFFTTSESYFNYNPITPDGYCSPVTINTALITLGKSLLFIDSRPFAGGLWFLGGLFFVTLGYAFLQFILKKLNFEKYHIVISILFLVVGWLCITSNLYVKIPAGKQICIILITEVLFTLGTYIRNYCLFPELNNVSYIGGFIYFYVLSYFLSSYDSISIASVDIVNPIFYLAGIITGGIGTYCLAKLCPLFSYLGNRTIPILALHLMSFKIISIIQWKIYNEDNVVLALYPVYNRSPILFWSIGNCIVGIVIPLLVCVFLSKFKICRFLLKC